MSHDSMPEDGIRVLDPLPLTVPRSLVLLRLGYRRAEQASPRIVRLLDEVSGEAAGLLAPRAVLARFPVACPERGELSVGGALRTASRTLRRGLTGCRTAVVFAATVGPALENRVRALADAGEMTRSLLGDAYGSAAAIALGRAVGEVVGRAFARQGLAATRRCAPGYGDWSLADQATLLGLLEAQRIGITLSAEALMTPAKSISGVIGGRLPAGRGEAG